MHELCRSHFAPSVRKAESMSQRWSKCWLYNQVAYDLYYCQADKMTVQSSARRRTTTISLVVDQVTRAPIDLGFFNVTVSNHEKDHGLVHKMHAKYEHSVFYGSKFMVIFNFFFAADRTKTSPQEFHSGVGVGHKKRWIWERSKPTD